MRKTILIQSLGLALVLGAGVAVSSAQPPATGRDRGAQADTIQRGRRGPGGPGGPEGRRGGRGPEGALLRGITLSDAQKQQVTALREQQRARREAERQQLGANRDGARADQRQPRQRPDSATIAARRQQFQAQRQRDEAALRAILTPEQRKQFDANRAELEKRFSERQVRGGREGGRGPRAEWRGRQG